MKNTELRLYKINDDEQVGYIQIVMPFYKKCVGGNHFKRGKAKYVFTTSAFRTFKILPIRKILQNNTGGSIF